MRESPVANAWFHSSKSARTSFSVGLTEDDVAAAGGAVMVAVEALFSWMSAGILDLRESDVIAKLRRLWFNETLLLR